MTKPLVKLDRDGHVAIVSFNRPEKLNVWAWGPTNELCAIADELRFDTSVRVVLMRGEGRAFCAGEDLKPETDDVEERHPGRSAAERTHISYERARYCFDRWKVVDQLPQPVVAAIQGYCLGAGLELAMLADIRIAATDAIFALPQVTLGTQIVGGADLRMVSELGAGRTKMLAMTGRRFGPAEAEQWGLVQQVVEPEALQQTALDLAHEIANNAPLAVQGVKRAVNFVAYRGFEEAAKFEAMASSVLWSSDDVMNGFAAKARKEQAEFEGEVSAPNDPPRSSFHDACRSERVADGVYERHLDESYWGHEAQFGGFAHALVVAAMRDELGASAPATSRDELGASAPATSRDELGDVGFAPVSMSMHFIRPFLTGRFRCEVHVVRRGRNMANLHANVYSSGKLAGQAIAAFGRRREVGSFLAAAPPPELALPVGPHEAPHDPGMGIPTHRHFDFWPRVGSSIDHRADGNRVGGWVRMRDEPTLDELTLVMINDLWVPAAYHLWQVGHVAVSADITTQFRGVLPAAIAPGDPVFVQLRTAASAGGFVDEDTEVWTAAGELLCQGRQMRFVHG